MKVAIIGSRRLMLDIERYVPKDTTLIISGGAKGIDTIAEQYADKYGIEKCIIKPQYQKYGRNAPLIRNREIIEKADLVLAFWDGISPGTKHSLEYAVKCGKAIQIYQFKVQKEEAS